MMVLSPSCKSVDKIGNICLSLIFLENSLRQSLRVCFIRMCHPSSASLKETGRESGKDWQQIQGVELLRWPLLHKGSQTNVAGSSAGDHSVTKDLFRQNTERMEIRAWNNPSEGEKKRKDNCNLPLFSVFRWSNVLPGD